MKVRQGQDGLFYVESNSKREVQEQTVNIQELACTCPDDACRLRPRRRERKPFVAWPDTERTVCRHTTQVLLFLGLQVAEQLKKQQR